MALLYTGPIGPTKSGGMLPSSSLPQDMRSKDNSGGLFGMLGGAPIPSLTGGGSSAASGLNTRTDFGSVYVNNQGGAFFWLFLLGAGYLIWRQVKK